MPRTKKASFQARILEWILWRLRMKKKFAVTDGLRERVIASRPSRLGLPASLSRGFLVTETARNGRPIFTVSPKTGQAPWRVLYLHGGAYVYELQDKHWGMIKRLMDTGLLEITIPFYPLAPEHTCDEVLAFAREVFEEMRTQVPGQPIAILGDSAGGGMALSVSQLLRDAGKAQPACLVLVSPWLDVTCSDPRQEQLEAVDPILALPGLREEGRWYAGPVPPTDPRVSPLFGELGSLPPMLVLSGTHDLLNPDAHRLQERCSAVSCDCTLSEYTGMLHVWPAMPVPEAGMAVEEMVAFLRQHSGAGTGSAVQV